MVLTANCRKDESGEKKRPGMTEKYWFISLELVANRGSKTMELEP